MDKPVTAEVAQAIVFRRLLAMGDAKLAKRNIRAELRKGDGY